MQSRSGRVEHGPIRQQRHRHRRVATPGATLVHPIADHAGTHRAVADRAQRDLPDDTAMLFDGEHGTGTGPFVAPQLFHPFLVGDGGAVQRIAGFPRLEPGIVAPANLVPLVIVGTRQRAQTHRDAHAVRLDEFRHFKGIIPRTTHHVAQGLQNRHPSIVPHPYPMFRFPRNRTVVQRTIWTCMSNNAS